MTRYVKLIETNFFIKYSARVFSFWNLKSKKATSFLVLLPFHKNLHVRILVKFSIQNFAVMHVKLLPYVPQKLYLSTHIDSYTHRVSCSCDNFIENLCVTSSKILHPWLFAWAIFTIKKFAALTKCVNILSHPKSSPNRVLSLQKKGGGWGWGKKFEKECVFNRENKNCISSVFEREREVTMHIYKN